MSNLQKGEDCLKIRRPVKIKAFGMKISTFITMLRSSGVVCSSQRCSSGEFSAYIYLSDLEKAEDIAEKTGTVVTETAENADLVDACMESVEELEKIAKRFSL